MTATGERKPGVRPRAVLALEDGSRLRGAVVRAAPARRPGEVVFNTALCGYQEVLTDPSYAGQIVTMTYPHIGNYGVNREDVESARPQVAGFVVREASTVASSWRASGDAAPLPRRARHRRDQRDRHARADPPPAHARGQARRRLARSTPTAARSWPRRAPRARWSASTWRARSPARPGVRPASERERRHRAGAEGHRAPARASLPGGGLRLRDEAQHPAQPGRGRAAT